MTWGVTIRQMINIGIIGSDSSHAVAFASLLNSREQAFANVSVTHIWGEEPERTREAAAAAGIAHVVDTPGNILGKVDAAMIVLRDGGSHLRYALPFLREGVPLFVDKPFAQSRADALAMERAALEGGALLTGGSTCRYIPAVAHLRRALEAAEKAPVSALMSFEADRESPYGGLWFYGPHLVDMCLAVFGCAWQDVQVQTLPNAVCAMVRYNGFGVTLQFVKNNPQNLAVLDFGSHMACVDLEIGQCYPLGMRAFAAMLAGTQPGPPPGFFSSSVALMGAIGSGAEAGKKTEVRSRTDVE